jgi:hypothetical protein
LDFKGVFQIEDLTNKVTARLAITEKPNALINGVFGMFGKKENEVVPEKNEFKFKVFKRVSGEKIVFANGAGNYARYFAIDKKIYYAHSRIQHLNWIPEEHTDKTLPSSAILRKEIASIKAAKLDEAQAYF